MAIENAAEENWQVLVSLFPPGWDRTAFREGAVERLRGFPSAEALLRTLLLHVGRGHSLRETAAQARLAGLATVSDVTVLQRLRQSEQWLRRLCLDLLAESGLRLRAGPAGRTLRVLDGTVVQEPGRTGSQWRIHYSVQLPAVVCDYFEITAVRGAGTGETMHRFPMRHGDLILADRGFSKPPGIEAAVQQGADVLVRVNTASLPLRHPDGAVFPLLERLRQLQADGEVGSWDVLVSGAERVIAGRLCAMRKSEIASRQAQRRSRRKALKRGREPKPETLEYARYVIVFTTMPADELAAAEVLEWYRFRWQIELVFKRLKTIAQIGHLPKHQDASARAWLYGKLLIALLTQKLVQIGRTISPWGYLSEPKAAERLA